MAQCPVPDWVIDLIYERLGYLARCMRSLQTTANSCARAACRHLNIVPCPQSRYRFYAPTKTAIKQYVCYWNESQIRQLVNEIDVLIRECARTTFLTDDMIRVVCQYLRCVQQ